MVLGDRLKTGLRLIWLYTHNDGRRLSLTYFADIFVATPRGRPTIPARTVATVMLPQSFEGPSDREALQSARARGSGAGRQAPSRFITVPVGIRNRLLTSDPLHRVREETLSGPGGGARSRPGWGWTSTALYRGSGHPGH